MSFVTRPIDITKIKCDVIVNSLGTDTITYGKICQSIVRAAKSVKLRETIDSKNGKVKQGDFFITPGYSLKAKHIIHLVTPYYVYDNTLKALELCYMRVLMTAVKNNWKNIAIPLMGTGANKYPHFLTLKMVTTLISSFCSFYQDFNVTLCVPVVSHDDFEKNFDKEKFEESFMDSLREIKLNARKTFTYSPEDFDAALSNAVEDLLCLDEMPLDKLILEKNKLFTTRIPSFLEEDVLLLEAGKRPVKFDMTKLAQPSVTHYINEYIDTRYENQNDRNRVEYLMRHNMSADDNISSLKYKHYIVEKRETISKTLLMRYILSLHMNKEEADDFFLFCGKSFSPVSGLDIFFEELIHMRIFDTDVVNSLCVERKIQPIFDFKKAPGLKK